LGLGTWPMTDDEVEVAITRAIEVGYRLVDTAESYHNEQGVGRGIRASGLARSQIFVTTKFRIDMHPGDGAQQALEASLGRLGLDYVDLYLIHWPMPHRDRYVGSWEALLELKRAGLARAVGVSNFKPAHIDRLAAMTGELPAVNQIQLDPSLARPEPRRYHALRGIVTQSYSPLAKGGAILGHPAICALAEHYGKTPAQVVLRWHLDLGLSAVAKTSRFERLRDNLDIFDFHLSEGELASLAGLDRGERAAFDSDAVD
jgi:2,5-diketo-D-gluconate reductase A